MLAETHGAWSEGPINRYAQQWERCDAAGNNCIAIAGATARTYLPVAADAGHTVRVAETATNAQGTGGPAPSPATGVVGALPKLGFLSIRPRAFRAARHGPPVTRSRMHLAAAVRYELNVRASVRFSVQRTIAGRVVGGRCEPRVSRQAHGSALLPACRRWAAASTSQAGPATAAFRFSGRLNGRRLTPGNYQLTAVPTGIGGHGSPQTATFTILQ